MYTLYMEPGTGGFVVQAALEEAGVDYRVVEVSIEGGEHRSGSFLELNPMGLLPVLDLGEDGILTETAAMVIHIVDRHPEAGLGPAPADPARPAFLRWLTFMAVNLYQTMMRAYKPERYTTNADGAGAIKAAALADIDMQFAILDNALESNPYLAGERYSAADAYLLMCAHWHSEPDRLFSECPNIARLCDSVRKRDKIARINEYHKLW
jgi:glutathione S-transferase